MDDSAVGITAVDLSVGTLVSSVRSRFLQELDAELAAFGLTGAQFPVLRQIVDGSAHTAADLCRSMNYDTGSMTRMLDRLEDKGMIQRERDSVDRRLVHIKLTPAGEKIYPELAATAHRVISRGLAGFDARDVETLKSLLQRILGNLQNHTRAASEQ